MTNDDTKRIFNCDETIQVDGHSNVSVDDFLEIAGFKNCEPTKQAMLDFDGGSKGYYDLINSINF